MIEGCKNVASRIELAKGEFVQTLQTMGGIERGAAVKVMAYYLTHRIAKLDPVMGKITVKHGAFLDRDTILRAAAIA